MASKAASKCKDCNAAIAEAYRNKWVLLSTCCGVPLMLLGLILLFIRGSVALSEYKATQNVRLYNAAVADWSGSSYSSDLSTASFRGDAQGQSVVLSWISGSDDFPGPSSISHYTTGFHAAKVNPNTFNLEEHWMSYPLQPHAYCVSFNYALVGTSSYSVVQGQEQCTTTQSGFWIPAGRQKKVVLGQCIPPRGSACATFNCQCICQTDYFGIWVPSTAGSTTLGSCFQTQVLNNVCISVAKDGNAFRFVKGCHYGDNAHANHISKFITIPKTNSSDVIAARLNQVTFEVRHEKDPYIRLGEITDGSYDLGPGLQISDLQQNNIDLRNGLLAAGLCFFLIPLFGIIGHVWYVAWKNSKNRFLEFSGEVSMPPTSGLAATVDVPLE